MKCLSIDCSNARFCPTGVRVDVEVGLNDGRKLVGKAVVDGEETDISSELTQDLKTILPPSEFEETLKVIAISAVGATKRKVTDKYWDPGQDPDYEEFSMNIKDLLYLVENLKNPDVLPQGDAMVRRMIGLGEHDEICLEDAIGSKDGSPVLVKGIRVEFAKDRWTRVLVVNIHPDGTFRFGSSACPTDRADLDACVRAQRFLKEFCPESP